MGVGVSFGCTFVSGLLKHQARQTRLWISPDLTTTTKFCLCQYFQFFRFSMHWLYSENHFDTKQGEFRQKYSVSSTFRSSKYRAIILVPDAKTCQSKFDAPGFQNPDTNTRHVWYAYPTPLSLVDYFEIIRSWHKRTRISCHTISCNVFIYFWPKMTFLACRSDEFMW